MRCHDPRIWNDRSKKVETENAALISIEWCLLLYGSEFASHVDWEVIARRADKYDLQVYRSKRSPANPDVDRMISAKA
jgi:hypothetical protein